jgi:hypothetical protein
MTRAIEREISALASPGTLKAFFIRIDVIDEALNVITMSNS